MSKYHIIRDVRKNKDMSQMQVVSLSGGLLTQYRLSCIERGLKPTIVEAAVIQGILGINLDDIYDWGK